MILFSDPTGQSVCIVGCVENYCEEMVSASTGDDVFISRVKVERLRSYVSGMIQGFRMVGLIDIDQELILRRDYLESALSESLSNIHSKFGEQSCF